MDEEAGSRPGARPDRLTLPGACQCVDSDGAPTLGDGGFLAPRRASADCTDCRGPQATHPPRPSSDVTAGPAGSATRSGTSAELSQNLTARSRVRQGTASPLARGQGRAGQPQDVEHRPAADGRSACSSRCSRPPGRPFVTGSSRATGTPVCDQDLSTPDLGISAPRPFWPR
jgi:hypothetical protein